MVSQFVSSHDVGLLGDLDYVFPEGTHAIGRLDNHSEGLLLLTTNKKVTRLLFEGAVPHKRTYLVQVKDVVNEESLHKLQTGVTIRIAGGIDYTTPACDVEIVDKPSGLIDGAFEYRPDIPHTWLLITLTEGKYHQVRKMVKAVRHRCQRLIRVSIEDMKLGSLPAGAVREFEEKEFFELLKIDNYQ
ncbi:MAG: rRNA pseudouridine synthase [Flavipsychrobacter sp.]|nr:rRNA pseudouridine synthase [Flavipsychrobacter sp.]